MNIRLCSIVSFCCIAMLVGCSNKSSPQAGEPTPNESGWTRIGQIAVPQDRDNDIVRASHLTATCSSIRFEADGPAEIQRIVVTYDNGSAFVADRGFTFDKAGSQILELPGGQHKIDRVALVSSGGRLFHKTTVVLWAK